MKKTLLLLSSFLLAANILFAQDDELPPPSSKPKAENTGENNQQAPPDANDFEGFKKKKKVNFDNFIIEPNVNLSILPGSIDIGLSPYVGYKIFEPARSKANGKNTGLFVGAGITYRYTGYTGIVITDYQGQPVGTAKANYHTYGGGVFLQYNIWKAFFVRAKMEVLHRDMADLNGQPIPKNPNNYSEGFYFQRINKTIPALLLGGGFNLLRSKHFFMPVMISYDVLHSIVDKKYSLYPRGIVIQLGFINLF